MFIKDVNKYVVIRIETTGIDCNRDEIIELCAVKVEDKKIVDKFNVLCKPTKEISKSVETITGIINEQLKNANEIKTEIVKFSKFISSSLSLVFYNAKFDIDFLEKYLGKDYFNVNYDCIDICEITKLYYPNLKNHRLIGICDFLGLEFKPNIMEEVEIISDVFEILKEKCTEIKFCDKELTLALISFLETKKVSKRDLMNLFKTSKENAEMIIRQLIEKKVIYNYNMDKDEMKIKVVSCSDVDSFIKNSNEEFCLINGNISIDGSLKEIKETLDERLKQEALKFSEDNEVSVISLQHKFLIGYSKACKLYNWLKMAKNGKK